MNVKFYLSETHACGHIRGEIPARAINASQNGARVDCKTDILLSDYFGTDVMVFQRQHHPDIYAKMEAAKSRGIKTVYEVDDDMLNMPEEFEKPYDFYRKPEVREVMLKFMRDCDALTVSTVELAESIRKMTPRPIFVVENAIDLERWRAAQIERECRLAAGGSKKTVMIGWMASGSHMIDMPLIEDAILGVMRDHAEVRLHLIGVLVREDIKHPGFAEFKDRITVDPWIEINALPQVMADIDIGLAPLMDNPFNRGKSGLKWMQYAALGIPGIYSDMPCYRRVVKPGVDGYLVPAGTITDWRKHLEELVTDAELRQRMGTQALRNVQAWDISVRAEEWVKAWRQIMTIWM